MYLTDQPSVPKMSEQLFRQRRNLMLVSLIIIFMRLGGVTIQKVGALGMELHFTNMQVLYVGLWIVFMYFFLRYYQYLRQEPDLGILSAFWSKVDNRCLNKVREVAARQFPTVVTSPVGGEFKISSLTRQSAFVWSGSVTTRRNEFGDITNSPYTVNVLRFWPDLIVAAYHVVVNRSAVTDYILPLFLVAMALICGWCGDWPGTICNILGGCIFCKLVS